MLFRSIHVLAASFFLSSIYASDDHDQDNSSQVISLDVNNFQSTIDSHKLIMVEFMTPWCGYCKALMPEYENAAKTLHSRNITLAKVDCSAPEESELCQKQEVTGYPTLKIFEDAKVSDYNGPRKSDGIVSFMVKRSLPAISIITSDNHTDFTQSSDVVVVAYLDQSDHESLEVYTSYAKSKRDDYIFGVCHDHSSIKDVSSLSRPSLVVWKKFDEGRNDFHGEKFTADSVTKFVSSNAVPLLDELSPNNFEFYSTSGRPLAYIFIEATNPYRESLLKSLEPLAKESKGKINFVWIDALKFADHAKSLNLPANHWPEFVIQDFSANTKFPLDSHKEVNHDNLAEFLKDFNEGNIKPSFKSQPIPVKQGPGSHVLVNAQFDEVVFGDSNKKDVFIEFYAPWCGHCKRLKPIWDNLANSFKDSNDKVLITKFDATENDVPPSSGIAVHGFPTLKFKKAGSKEFMDYEGDRTLDALIEFVEENSVNQVKAVKVEVDEEIEGGDSSEQMVFKSEEPEPVEDDKDAEHDEL
ncbi:hypothetical protein O181_072905 [Austropuccinia psidii MF-1]|uniref:Protein disulfide-isomerase n=1 Tax=Austropuccinia psidii MF-1 TaxID=1389203 RepID=A0A9Q3F1F5_9BASI|nr:hypothetical protein [Austropuccinia psidii MF-1]